MRAEVLALWGQMWFAHHLCIDRLSIYRDLQVLIDHLNKGMALNPEILTTWMGLDHIEIMRKKFTSITFAHIYREKNTQDDRLTKKGLTERYGKMRYELFEATRKGAKGTVVFS